VTIIKLKINSLQVIWFRYAVLFYSGTVSILVSFKMKDNSNKYFLIFGLLLVTLGVILSASLVYDFFFPKEHSLKGTLIRDKSLDYRARYGGTVFFGHKLIIESDGKEKRFFMYFEDKRIIEKKSSVFPLKLNEEYRIKYLDKSRVITEIERIPHTSSTITTGKSKGNNNFEGYHIMNQKFSRKIKITTIIFGILAVTTFYIGGFIMPKFTRIFLSNTFLAIALLLMSFPQINPTWLRQDLNPKIKLVLGKIFKLIFALAALGMTYFIILPYSLDIKPYILKEYSIEKGAIKSINISGYNKTGLSSVTVKVNDVEVEFDMLNRNSVDFFKRLKNDDLVELQYLPNSKYGIKITLY
jgi:hypothetical protein